MTDFNMFGLPAVLSASLVRMNFNTPTPIQAQAIPLALEGRDVLGSAQTGTGKTAAFCIPLVTHLINNPDATALVMTPTRELASQVLSVARDLMGRDSGLRTALLIGGDSMSKQFRQLDNRPNLIIGTPGRINDHLRRNRNLFRQTSFIVLDEADRMLDMGFTVQIDEVLKFLPEKRQTLMFSATIPHKIAEFSKRYMNNPAHISVQKSEDASATNITHEVMRLTAEEKYPTLSREIAQRDGSIIVFMKTKRAADKMAMRLQKDDHLAEAIHGDLKQSRRERVIRDFRAKKYRVLVATDVASRGLDVPHVEHVINYDLPQVAEDYIHRIGRTARAGAKGNALCLLLSSDHEMWRMIERLMNPGTAANSGDDRDYGPRRKPGQTRQRKPHRKGNRGFRPEGQRSEENRFEGKKFDRNRNEGRRFEKPRFERSEERSSEARPERNRFEGRKSEENRFEGRPERKKYDGYKGKSQENRSDTFKAGEKKFEGKKFDGKRSDRPEYQGRKSEDSRFNGKKFDRNRHEGKKPEENRFEGNRPERTKQDSYRSGEKRFENRKSEDHRSDYKPDRKFEGRPRFKDGSRSDNRSENKPSRRPDQRSEPRSDRKPEGGFENRSNFSKGKKNFGQKRNRFKGQGNRNAA